MFAITFVGIDYLDLGLICVVEEQCYGTRRFLASSIILWASSGSK
jgi:hypothetical protein